MLVQGLCTDFCYRCGFLGFYLHFCPFLDFGALGVGRLHFYSHKQPGCTCYTTVVYSFSSLSTQWIHCHSNGYSVIKLFAVLNSTLKQSSFRPPIECQDCETADRVSTPSMYLFFSSSVLMAVKWLYMFAIYYKLLQYKIH